MREINPAALMAVARRQLASYLTNPLGYIVILVFVLVFGASAFLSQEWYRRDLVDFAAVTPLMPWILAGAVPLFALGAWADERSRGTDELLLTMPMSATDALLGKYLAVVAFTTVALLANLAHVVNLALLGSPDPGLIAANFLGWWSLALAYAGLAVLGSALVANIPLAIILGFALCGGFGWVVAQYDVLAAFDRGRIDWGAVCLFAAVAVASLAWARFIVAARASGGKQLAYAGVQVALGLVLAVNLVVISARYDWSGDLSSDQLSSLPPEAVPLLADLPETGAPVRVEIYVAAADTLPDDLLAKAQEVLDKAAALQRQGGDRLEVEVFRPQHADDTDGKRAVDQFGLLPRDEIKRSYVSDVPVEVFLGAVVTCGGATQVIPWFEPGLAVDYELVRAVRSVANDAVIDQSAHVRLVVSEQVPEAVADRLERLTDWLDARAASQQLTWELLTVADPDAAAAEFGLSVTSVGVATASSADASDADVDADVADGSDAGNSDSDGLDADRQTEAGEQTTTQRVVLGALVDGPRFNSRVRWFGDTEGAGSQLANALRRARRTRPVAGVLATELGLTGVTGQATGGRYAILNELSREYEVRSVPPGSLDHREFDDIDVLIAGLPSSLLDNEWRRLEQWIVNGRPTLLMVDSLPITRFLIDGSLMAPAEPKMDPPMFPGMPPQPAADGKVGPQPVAAFLARLGIDVDLEQVVWSGYNPSRQILGLSEWLVWTDAKGGGMHEHAATTGIGSVITYGPTRMAPTGLQVPGLDVVPLVTVSGNKYGTAGYSQFRTTNPWNNQPSLQLDVPTEIDDALTFTGAYLAFAAQGYIPVSNAPDAELGPAPANLIVVGDTDWIGDVVMDIHRRAHVGGDRGVQRSDFAAVRNVQLFQNMVDLLIEQSDLLDLRARKPEPRTLEHFDRFEQSLNEKMFELISQRQDQARQAAEVMDRRFTSQVEEIDARQDLDLQSKFEQVVAVRERLEQEQAILTARFDDEIEQTRRRLMRETTAARNQAVVLIQLRMLLIPAAVLGVLVLLVTAWRIATERTSIPAERRRGDDGTPGGPAAPTQSDSEAST